MIVSSVRWVCLWWGASRINTWHSVQTWPQTAQTLQLFKEWPQPFFPPNSMTMTAQRGIRTHDVSVRTCMEVRAPEAQMTCQVEMEQKCPREVTQSGQEVFHWEWIYSRFLMGYILYLYFCYLWVRGGFLVCPTVTGVVTLRAVTRDCLFVGGTETRQERRGGTGQVFNNVIITTMPSWLTVVRRHMFPFLDRHCHHVIFVPLFIRTQRLRLVSRHVPLSDK